MADGRGGPPNRRPLVFYFKQARLLYSEGHWKRVSRDQKADIAHVVPTERGELRQSCIHEPF